MRLPQDLFFAHRRDSMSHISKTLVFTEQYSHRNAYWFSYFSGAAYANSEDRIKELLSMWISSAGVNLDSFSGAITQGFILETSTDIVIVFRGTQYDDVYQIFNDWKDNFNFEHNDFPGWDNARVHEGFYRHVNEVWSDIKPRLESAMHEGKKFWFTGHSLGGAAAAIAAARWVAECESQDRDNADHGQEIAGIYTYGAPEFCDSVFAFYFDRGGSVYRDTDVGLSAKTFRFVNHNDLVPRGFDELPSIMKAIYPFDSDFLSDTGTLEEYVHVGRLKYIDSYGGIHNQRVEDNLIGSIYRVVAPKRITDGVGDHRLINYMGPLSRVSGVPLRLPYGDLLDFVVNFVPMPSF